MYTTAVALWIVVVGDLSVGWLAFEGDHGPPVPKNTPEALSHALYGHYASANDVRFSAAASDV